MVKPAPQRTRVKYNKVYRLSSLSSLENIALFASAVSPAMSGSFSRSLTCHPFHSESSVPSFAEDTERNRVYDYFTITLMALPLLMTMFRPRCILATFTPLSV